MRRRGEAPKRTRWLEGSPAIKAQWDSSDTWKFEAITLRLNYALLAELAGIHDVFRQRDGGQEAVVIPHKVGQAGFLDRIDHGLALLAQCLLAVAFAQRAFSAVHVLARLPEGARCLHAVLAQLLHQILQHLAQALLAVAQAAGTGLIAVARLLAGIAAPSDPLLAGPQRPGMGLDQGAADALFNGPN